MSYNACISAIQKAAGGVLTDDDLEDLVGDIVKRRRARALVAPLEEDRVAFQKVAQDISNEERLAAAIEKRSRTINVLRKTQRQDFYRAFEGKEAEGISTLNVGSEKIGAGFGNSVSAQQKGIRADLMGPMMAELRASNLLDIIGSRHPEFERDVARNMWAITEAEVAKKTPALSGSEQAQQAAKILTKYQDVARQMQNDAGAWIGKLPGYIVRQSHDMFRIRKAGYEAWRDNIMPKLDPKVFDTVDKPEDFLRTIWTELSTGEHYREKGADDYLGGFKGPANRAKKLSEHRVLQFKSADDWLAYNDQFGSGGLMEAVIGGLNKAADNTALMRTWGTNPEAAFQADLAQARESAARRGDAQSVDKLKGWRIQSEFDQLTGAANIPGNPTWAQRGAFVRALLNMSSLGGVVLSSVPDNALKAAVLHHHGIGYLEGHANALGDLFRGRSSGESREIADHLGAGFDGMVGSIASRWNAGDTLPGKTARMQNWFFKMNLLNWWVDSKTTGAGLMMSHNLARNAAKDFDKLDPLLQTTLSRYGLGPDQWAVLRQVDMRLDGDTPYLMPDAINHLPDNVIAKLANGTGDKAMQRARDDLRINLRTFYAEELAAVNTMGGAKERALVTWGTKPGTPIGEAVRFMMQFKMFPITFATKHMAREFNRGGVPGMVHMILATTALGYVSTAAGEIAKGRQPRPFDADHWGKTLIASAIKGGGLGIYGDFLFGEYNRFGGGPLETLAGPGVGKIGEVLRAYSDAKDAAGNADGVKAGHVAGALLKTGISTIPGVNLFYTRAALDYLVLYQMQEWANPGYLRRMEKRIATENGQRFIVPPSGQIPYGGGTRLLEGVR